MGPGADQSQGIAGAIRFGGPGQVLIVAEFRDDCGGAVPQSQVIAIVGKPGVRREDSGDGKSAAIPGGEGQEVFHYENTLAGSERGDGAAREAELNACREGHAGEIDGPAANILKFDEFLRASACGVIVDFGNDKVGGCCGIDGAGIGDGDGVAGGSGAVMVDRGQGENIGPGNNGQADLPVLAIQPKDGSGFRGRTIAGNVDFVKIDPSRARHGGHWFSGREIGPAAGGDRKSDRRILLC